MSENSAQPSVIDLFAGAGGLSASLEAAGWLSVAAVEIDADCVATLLRNQAKGHLAGSRIVHADVKSIKARDLRPSWAGPSWRPDLLTGGPPCQTFSSAGRMQGTGDPRGLLFHELVRFADELRPRFILFENVAGLVTAKSPGGEVGGVLRSIQAEFERVGYACRFDLLNAADFGAPQRRPRLYMIASRDGCPPGFPTPTHAREPGLGRAPWVTLGEFLAFHPRPDSADVVRPAGLRAQELRKLLPGTGLRSGGIVEANRPGGHWGYRQDSFLADLSLPSRTIRAASTPDWVRLDGEPDLRRLTWRECALLQGFPADWEFVGTVASRFRQIGNAVQGQVGRSIAAALFVAREGGRQGAKVSAPWPACFHRRVRYTTSEELVNGAHRRAARGLVDAIGATTLV